MEAINNRRSIRKFTKEEVSDEKIEKLLRAGMQAPSAANQQPWEFLVLKSSDTREKLAKSSPYSLPAQNAPLNILVMGNLEIAKIPEIIDQDLGACVENILLEAVDLGLGAVWLGVKPDKERMQTISKLLDLPSHIEPFALLAVGYPETNGTFVDRFNKERIHYEKF